MLKGKIYYEKKKEKKNYIRNSAIVGKFFMSKCQENDR